MTIRVYRYGVAKHVHNGEFRTVTDKKTGRPKKVRKLEKVEVPEVVMDQLWLAHRLRETLVTVEMAFDAQCEQAWRTASPAIAAAMDSLAAADNVISETIKAARQERSERHSMTVSETTSNALKNAKKTIKEARATIKELKARTGVAEIAKPLLKDASDARAAAQKALYAQYCTRGVYPRLCNHCMDPEPTVNETTGVCSKCATIWPEKKLYWATFNKVLDQHKTALQRLIKARSQGTRAQLRHHSFDGTGRICVQLAREHGPACKCVKCVTREMSAWRVREYPDATITVERRATAKPKKEAVAETPVHSIESAAIMLSTAAGCPLAAINLAEGKGAMSKETGKFIIPWTPVVDGRALVGVGEPKDPARSPFLIASDKHKWLNVLQIQPWMSPEEFEERPSKKPILGKVRFHVDSSGSVELPIVLSRMIPADAEVTDAQLVVSREADRVQMHICVTLDMPDPTPVTEGAALAIHVGWRQMDNWVRVMTWASDRPLVIPPALLNWRVAPGVNRPLVMVHGAAGRAGEICLPKEWVELSGRAPSIQGIRAQVFNTVREKFAVWLEQLEQETGEVLPPFNRYRTPLSASQLRGWHSVDRFAAFATAFRAEERFASLPGADEMMDLLQRWADGDPMPPKTRGPEDFHGDRHLWRFAVHEAAALLRRRDDAWRAVSKWLLQNVAHLIMDDVDIAAMTRRAGEETTEADAPVPDSVAKKIRARSRLASPGILRSAFRNVADREGIQVTEANVGAAGRTCPACSYVSDSEDARWITDAMVTCDGCGRFYDQDTAVVRAMLIKVLTPPAEEPAPPAPIKVATAPKQRKTPVGVR